MGVLRGANAPLLQRMIVQKLGEEKMVLEKGVERKVVSHEINMYSVTHQAFSIDFSFHYRKITSVPDQILFNSYYFSCGTRISKIVYALLTLINLFDVFYLFQIKDSGLGEDEQKADVETQAEDNIIGKRLIVL